MSIDFTRGNHSILLKMDEITLTSKNAIITDLSINYNNFENEDTCYMMNGKSILIPLRKRAAELQLTMRFDDYDILFGANISNKKTIKNKIVDDCSIDELLFAITYKLNKADKNV